MHDMESVDPILEPIFASPRLAQYIEQLNRAFESEKERRIRFYEEITESDKAEFINGEPVYHSPVKMRHIIVGKNLLRLLSSWVDRFDYGFVANEKLMIELTRNSYEPDLCFFKSNKAVDFKPDQMIFPAPDFVVEILSPSKAQNDRGIKFEDYATHGIEEYWIIDPKEETVEQYLLDGEKYDLKLKVTEGTITAVAVPGFTIPVRAIFDKKENLKALQTLLSDNR